MKLEGIHHISAITGDARRNVVLTFFEYPGAAPGRPPPRAWFTASSNASVPKTH